MGSDSIDISKLVSLQPIKTSEGKLVTSYCNFGVDKIEHKKGTDLFSITAKRRKQQLNKTESSPLQ
jgi:hypothetical protein